MIKLFEQDAFLTDFDATVISCQSGNHGWDIVLNQTAFYPEGGGQPYDIGTLGSVNVTEVHGHGDAIIHCCDAPLAVGSVVKGAIDWARRFDLMQQHSGEHIVSGLAHSMFGCDNVGFHMGSDVITIDLNVELSDEQVASLEAAANRYIWKNIPIQIDFPSAEALDALDYRSKKALTGQVRIVTFPDADCCACCGTHVTSAGQVGLIKLLSCQKFRDGVRLELLCGGRALLHYNKVYQQNRQVSNLLSAKPMETASATQRALDEVSALKSRIAILEDAHFQHLAQSVCEQSGSVLLCEQGLSPTSLRRLADAILARHPHRVACFSGSDATGYQYAIGLRGGNLREFSKALNVALQGRGGGKPDFVQGSVSANWDVIESFFSENP